MQILSMKSKHFLFLSLGAYQINALKCGPPVEKPSDVLTRWWDAYPITKSFPSSVTAEEIVALKKDRASGAQFAVIDLRRYDHGVCISR
jgi:arsenite methyltransferase